MPMAVSKNGVMVQNKTKTIQKHIQTKTVIKKAQKEALVPYKPKQDKELVDNLLQFTNTTNDEKFIEILDEDSSN